MATVTDAHDLTGLRGDGPTRPPFSVRDRRARRLAREVHAGQTDRHGEPMVDHVERVAAQVPTVARPVALVHDVCERSALRPEDVAALIGLEQHEREALALLTKKAEGEGLLDHTRRVVTAPAGRARELAVVVKRADVEDHLRGALVPEPRYHVARALLASASNGAIGPG